jgi:hypothetical protein
MDQAVLVVPKTITSEEILSALERGGIPTDVALWAYLPEYEEWRLVLASRHLDQIDLKKVYGVLRTVLEREGITRERTPPVMIFRMKDPMIRSLRRIFGKAKSVEGMRLGGQVFGDRYIEDAYVFRIR